MTHSSFKPIGWALALCVVLPLFLQLGGRGLNEPDEGRYAEIGREMLVSGDWLVPRLNGVPHYAKPPWTYWCVAASMGLFGINEWAVRLPAALAATVTALTAFALGRRMAGTLAGIVAALALVTSLLFFGVGRLITPDMIQTACITAALYCFWRWWLMKCGAGGLESVAEGRGTGRIWNLLELFSKFVGRRSSAPSTGHGAQDGRPTIDFTEWRWLLGFYAILGIAFLNKGPVALAICVLTIVGFLFLMRRLGELPRLGWGRGLLLVAAIGLPWYLILAHRNPDLYDFYLVGEVKDRVMSGRGRVKAWYYFFLVLPLACWPWTMLAVSAFRRHFGWWWNRDHHAEASAFLLAWILFPLGLFTLSSSKLPTYILPLLVPVSLLVGLWAADLFKREKSVPAWANLATCLFLPLPLVGVVYFALMRSVPKFVWSAREGQLVLAVAAGAILVGLFTWWVLRFFNRGNPLATVLGAWWLGAAVFLQLLVFNMGRLETMLGHNSSWRELCRSLEGIPVTGSPIEQDLHPVKDDSLRRAWYGSGPGPHGEAYDFYLRVACGDRPRVVIYDYYFRAASFYLMRNRPEVVPVFGCESLWEIERDKEAEDRNSRNDLVQLLKGSDTYYVFAKPEARDELRRLTGLELPVLKSAASGKYQLVLFCNRKME